jgi:hypothetical protein
MSQDSKYIGLPGRILDWKNEIVKTVMKAHHLLSFIGIVGALSCNPDSTNDNWTYTTLEISNAPSGSYNFLCNGAWHFLSVDGSLFFEAEPLNTQVPSGSYFPYQLWVMGGPAPGVEGCADIELKTYNNGTLIDTRNFQLGYASLSPLVVCDNTAAGGFMITLSIEGE